MAPRIPEPEIRSHLERVLSSRTFARSERLSRLLRYMVEMTLDGRGDELKEYLLGIEVFDKDASFDPATDTIVRVQVRRLRAKLAAYYQSEGREEPVRISIPTGGYVPGFSGTHPGGVERVPRLRIWHAVALAGIVIGAALSGWVLLGGGRGRKTGTPNPEARELYLSGRYYRSLQSPDALLQSVTLFEQAVTRDPRYAEAHAALAGSLAVAGFHQLMPHLQAVTRGEAAAQQALALDPGSAEAQAALAWIRFYYHRDWGGAETLLRRALALEPSLAALHQRYAFVLVSRGRFEEAITESRRAAELDPSSFMATSDLAMVLYYARRFEEAARQADHTLRRKPGHPGARVVRGACLAATGKSEQALAELEGLVGSGAEVAPVLGRWGHACALAGKQREALAALERLRGKADTPGDHYTQMAFIHAGLGQPDQAVAALRKAVERREGESCFLAVEPVFDPLRARPDFAHLLRASPPSRR